MYEIAYSSKTGPSCSCNVTSERVCEVITPAPKAKIIKAPVELVEEEDKKELKK